MPLPADSLFSDPSVQFLPKLLDDIRAGHLILPRFQRPFVWDKQRRLELFDSVRKGIPIGSVMIWETRADEMDVQVVPKVELGPFKLPTVMERATPRYLLDGEQRLMTLYFALHRPDERAREPGDDDPSEAFEVLFDLERDSFVTRADLDDGPQAHHFPLRDILVPRGVLAYQRKLERALEERLGATSTAEERAAVEKKIADFIERSDTIAEAVRRYKIPVTVLSTDDVELAVETFKRVNSQGVAMSEAHMMNAISWTRSFDLLDRFAELRQGIDEFPLWQQGDNLDDDVLLRVAKRLLDRDVYDEKVSEIAPRLRDGKILQRVGESMTRCARFLAERGLRNPAHIPNVMQLVVLGRVFDDVPEPSPTALDGLEDWVWFTSYTEVFAKGVRGRVYESLEAQALAIARGQPPRALSHTASRKPLPRFDFRSTRARALAWMFAKRMMPHDGGDAADALASGGAEVLLRLAAPPRSREIAGSAALRVLCRPEQLRQVRDRLEDGPEDGSFFDAQVLSGEALAALRQHPGDVTTFARLREHALNELEEQRFREIQGRLFSGSSPPEVLED